MGKVDPTMQTAPERRAAEAELKALLERYAPEHLALVGVVRRKLRKLLPTAHEVVYEYGDFVVSSFTPRGHGHEGVLSFHASDEGVKVYLSGGKDLPDPEELLQGSAKQVRWIPVESASTLKRAAVVALMEAAMALNKIPFAKTGKGSVVVRETTAKKRRVGRAKG